MYSNMESSKGNVQKVSRNDLVGVFGSR
jgi:hypothetical protein